MTKLLTSLIASLFLCFSASAQTKVLTGPKVVASFDLPTDIHFMYIVTWLQRGQMPIIQLQMESFKKHKAKNQEVYLNTDGLCEYIGGGQGHRFHMSYFYISSGVMYSTIVDMRAVLEPDFRKSEHSICEVVGNRILIKSWQ